jgi:diguanylate cyclase (GGDEF)-like protein
MNQEKLNAFFRTALIIIGGSCFMYAVFRFDPAILNFELAALFLFTLTIGTRLSLIMPRSNFAVSFSDAAIFLAFLFYGGETAIILASLEAAVSCLYLKRKGLNFTFPVILFNFGMTAVSTAMTFLLWQIAAELLKVQMTPANSSGLITNLGILAVCQFVLTSGFAAMFYTLKSGETFLEAWKHECFSSSMSQIAGASFAGIIYKLISAADLTATVIASVVVGIVYFNYRYIFTEINDTIEKAEQAERDKAEVERVRAVQAEKHARELEILLKKEEEISRALRKSKIAFQHSAMHDTLTGLANRASFGAALRETIENCKKSPEDKCFLIFLDISRFKNINDHLGHGIGDKVLMIVAKRLLRLVGAKDVVARIGGDEFAMILNNCSLSEAQKLARRIYDKIAEPFSLSGNSIFIGVNVGIAPFESDYNTPEEILRDADIAMHHAKATGNGTAIFDKELREGFLDKITLEADLRFAVERGELSMHYQPLISLKDGRLIGFEALLRWQHSRRGFISPAQFIPIAEDSGLIIPITTWILRETCRQLSDWQKLASDYRNLIISVNISGKHLDKESLIEDVQNALANANLSGQSLKLEITESAVMENAELTIKILEKLKELGVKLSIDDFGTGYSSLSYLHRLPFDTLKIDRSFVYSVGDSGENSEILQTIISLAKNLKMRVIAEGIETESQLALLQNLGCDYGQGYLLAKPMPQEKMEEMLYQKRFWLPEKDNSFESFDYKRQEANNSIFNISR